MSVTMRSTLDMRGWSEPLQELARRAHDFTPAHRIIGEVLVGAVRHNIATQGDGQWPELSEATLLSRARGRLGKAQVFRVLTSKDKRRGITTHALTASAQRRIEIAKALIWSGRLLRSITYVAAAGWVDVGSNLVYAARQFFGSAPGVTPATPARNPFTLHGDEEREISRIYEQFLTGRGM